MHRLSLLFLLLFIPGILSAAPPAKVGQLLVGISEDWESTQAKLWAFEKSGSKWEAKWSSPIPVLLGRNGLAWGRGVLSTPKGTLKREGDGKTPAGYFAIGQIYGYPEHLPSGASFPYRKVGYYDCWIDDVSNPHYNQHYVAKPGQEPPWFQSQRMRLGDAAYKYRIEVRHNSDPPVAGYGSAIFFHVRRGPTRPTAGCTTMAESDLVRVIQWLRDHENPHYVILPRAEYGKLQRSWQLPEIP